MEKVTIIASVKAGESICIVMQNIGVAPTNLCDSWKWEVKKMEAHVPEKEEWKCICLGRFEQMEDILAIWFQHAQREHSDPRSAAPEQSTQNIQQFCRKV